MFVKCARSRNAQNTNIVTESKGVIKLAAGSYCIKVVPNYYSSLDYMLSVRTTENSYIVTTTTPPAVTTTTTKATTTTTTKATTTTSTTKKTTTTTTTKATTTTSTTKKTTTTTTTKATTTTSTTKKTTTTTTTKATTTTSTTKKTTTTTTTKATTTTSTTKKTTTTTTAPVTTTTVTTTTTNKPTLVNSGDINCDGKIDQTDVQLMIDLLAGRYMPTVQGYINADINGDANVDSEDLKLLVQITGGSSTKRGDVDLSGMVDVADAVLLARFLSEDKDAEITQQGKINADCNKSGAPDQQDVILILKAIARLITL